MRAVRFKRTITDDSWTQTPRVKLVVVTMLLVLGLVGALAYYGSTGPQPQTPASPAGADATDESPSDDVAVGVRTAPAVPPAGPSLLASGGILVVIVVILLVGLFVAQAVLSRRASVDPQIHIRRTGGSDGEEDKTSTGEKEPV